MNSLQTVLNELSTTTAIAENLARTDTQPPVSISQPIDVGADELLRDYRNAWLTYPPLEVEYLVQTLNEHINNCLDLRLKAQELEIKAFSEISDQLLQRKLVEALKSQIAVFAENEPKLLGNTINSKYDNTTGKIYGDQSAYWKKMLDEQESQLKIKIEDSDKRLIQLNESGSGSNYVQRFSFLKEMFKIDLIEAYCRARAASVGLKAIYDIGTPVPDITNVGYLDKLSLWARTITYEFEKKFFNIRETTVAFALNDGSTGAVATAPPVYDIPRIMSLDSFRQVRIGGSFTFNLPATIFERLNLKLKNPRLRGIDVHVIPNDTKQPMQFWRIFVKPPEKKITIAAGVQPYSYEPSVYIPMATYIAHTSELNIVPNQREVNNVNPIGEWTIRIEPKSILGNVDTNNDYVDNLLVRLRIAYDKD